MSKQREALFPEELLRNTPWEAEWYDENRRDTVKLSRIYLPVSMVAWLAHIWLVDIPMNLQPADLWLTFRLSMAAIAFVCSVLTFVPAISNSKLHWVPFALAGFAFNYWEAHAMRWSDQIHVMLPVLFTFYHAFALKLNLFWSLLYGLTNYSLQWPHIAHAYRDNLSTAYSCILLGVMGIFFFRNRHVHDVKAFLNIRQLAEAQKREAEAKEKVLTKELELSGAVQSLLLPAKESMEDENVLLVGRSIPATHCGGDWWWYHQHGDKVRVLLGDVTGHGAGPAMVTATVSSFTKVLYDPDRPFGELLTNLKQHYFDYFVNSKYWMTLTGCEIDLSTGRVCTWFAGSPPVFCVNGPDNIDVINEIGSPLGSDKGGFGYAETALNPGGKLILTTDGMIEARRKGSENSIGLRRVQGAFKRMADQDGRELIENFFAYVLQERGDNPQDDDYTFIVIDRPDKAGKLVAA